MDLLSCIPLPTTNCGQGSGEVKTSRFTAMAFSTAMGSGGGTSSRNWGRPSSTSSWAGRYTDIFRRLPADNNFTYARPILFYAQESTNLNIEGIHFKDPPIWQQLIETSEYHFSLCHHYAISDRMKALAFITKISFLQPSRTMPQFTQPTPTSSIHRTSATLLWSVSG